MHFFFTKKIKYNKMKNASSYDYVDRKKIAEKYPPIDVYK